MDKKQTRLRRARKTRAFWLVLPVLKLMCALILQTVATLLQLLWLAKQLPKKPKLLA